MTADKPGALEFAVGFTNRLKKRPRVWRAGTRWCWRHERQCRWDPGRLEIPGAGTVLAEGGTCQETNGTIGVSGANAATLLVAIATSYKNFRDVTGDPEELTKRVLAQASAKSFETLHRDQVAEHQRLFRRVQLDLGSTPSAKRPTNERIKDFAEGKDPQLAALYFQFGRYLLISSSRPGRAAGESSGDLEREHEPALGQQIHDQYQHGDELLAGGCANLGECVEPLLAMVQDLTDHRRAHGPDDVRGRRLGRPSQHRSLAGSRSHRRADGGIGPRAAPGSAKTCTSITASPRMWIFCRQLYPAMKGAAQFFLDTLVEEPNPQMARDLSLRFSGKSAPQRGQHLRRTDHGRTNHPRPVQQLHRSCDAPEHGHRIPREARGSSRPAGAQPDWQGRPTPGMARRLGHGSPGSAPSARLASLRPFSQARRSPCAARRSWRRR